MLDRIVNYGIAYIAGALTCALLVTLLEECV